MLWIEVAKQRHMGILSLTKEKGESLGAGKNTREVMGWKENKYCIYIIYITDVFYIWLKDKREIYGVELTRGRVKGTQGGWWEGKYKQSTLIYMYENFLVNSIILCTNKIN